MLVVFKLLCYNINIFIIIILFIIILLITSDTRLISLNLFFVSSSCRIVFIIRLKEINAKYHDATTPMRTVKD